MIQAQPIEARHEDVPTHECPRCGRRKPRSSFKLIPPQNNIRKRVCFGCSLALQRSKRRW